MNARDNIIRVAKSYIGTCEGSSNHADIIHMFNTVKPLGYTAKRSDPWCAEFVSACAIQAFGKKTALKYFPLSAGCPMMIKRAKQLGIWNEDDAYKPKKGDFILYDWEDSGKGNNTGIPNHVGICEKIKDGVITVIEGNYSDKVKRRQIKINGRFIRGFITPHYDEIPTGKIELKPVQDIALEVIKGDWGNGEQRKKALVAAGYDYNEIQKEVNRIMKGEK